jgi:hypothetical protein
VAKVYQELRHGVDRASDHAGRGAQAVAFHEGRKDLDALGRAQLVHTEHYARALRENQYYAQSLDVKICQNRRFRPTDPPQARSKLLKLSVEQNIPGWFTFL